MLRRGNLEGLHCAVNFEKILKMDQMCLIVVWIVVELWVLELAFVKILEAIAAAAGLVYLVLGYFGISTLFDGITASVNAVINQYLPTAIIRLPGFAAKSSFLLPAIFLVLLMLDGIGTFMIRFLNRGENLVRFVHLIYQIAAILEIILFIVVVILLLHYASDGSTAAIAAFGAFGILMIPITGGGLAVLFFQSGFQKFER